MILDEGSPIAVTEGSMKVINPRKLNLIHLPQNLEPVSTENRK
jgi:hypothetical protein